MSYFVQRQNRFYVPTPAEETAPAAPPRPSSRSTPSSEAGAERFEVLAQGRHAHVVGVLELGDRPLRHVEAAGELGLADRFTVTKLVRPDLLERLDTQPGETLADR